MRECLCAVLLVLGIVHGLDPIWTPGNPQADGKAMVTVGFARFTVLTPHVIRMEANPRGPSTFNDQQTSVIWNRRLPVPTFSVSQDPTTNTTIIDTSALTLTYNPAAGSPGRFSDDNLSVKLKEPNVWNVTAWSPSMTAAASGSLLGTFHSLDNLNGWQDLNCSSLDFVVHDEPMHCVHGLVSKAGWAVVDDAQSPIVADAWFTTPTAGTCSDPTVTSSSTEACYGSDLVSNNPSSEAACMQAGCCWVPTADYDKWVELELYWSEAAADNAVVTASHLPAQSGYKKASFQHPAYIYRPDRPQPGNTSPVRLWYSSTLRDHWTTASTAGEAAAKAANYSLVATLGYMLSPNATDLTTTTTTGSHTETFNLYFSQSRNDHFSSPTCSGCGGSGYVEVRPQGNVFVVGNKAPCRRRGGNTDLYFFGHGAQYKQALRDFALLTGPIPIPPRHMLGVSWSRWDESNTDADYLDFVGNLTDMGVGLSTFVADMDWHMTKTGWTGYTWSPSRFPDHKAVFGEFHSRGIHTGLNLHDAEGVQQPEKTYPAFAAHMNVTPPATVPFAIDNKAFFFGLESIVLNPILEDPNNPSFRSFHWTDWQQGMLGIESLGNANPTWLLNHLRFQQADNAADGLRGQIHSRWPGWGGHRYPTQFGGDVVQTWASLSFMVYYTTTASNALAAYWGHEMMANAGPGSSTLDLELYVRVIQFGAWSPVFTSWGNVNSDNLWWQFPEPYRSAVIDVLRDRTMLIPYRYTLAREAHDTSVGTVRPMYYDYPFQPAAYECLQQYAFGDSVLVSPVQTPMATNNTANSTVWLPPNTAWVPFKDPTGQFSLITGAGPDGTHVDTWVGLSSVPAWVRQGAVLPMIPASVATSAGGVSQPFTSLEWVVYAPDLETSGGGGNGRVYEDDGLTAAYESSTGAVSSLNYTTDATSGCVEVDITTVGTYTGMPANKTHTLVIRGHGQQPSSVSVGGKSVSNVPAPATKPLTWSWDKAANDVRVVGPDGDAHATTSMSLCF